MKKLNLNNLYESLLPPESTNVLWADIDENTKKLKDIKEYNNSTGEWEPVVISSKDAEAAAEQARNEGKQEAEAKYERERNYAFTVSKAYSVQQQGVTQQLYFVVQNLPEFLKSPLPLVGKIILRDYEGPDYQGRGPFKNMLYSFSFDGGYTFMYATFGVDIMNWFASDKLNNSSVDIPIYLCRSMEDIPHSDLVDVSEAINSDYSNLYVIQNPS